MRGPLIRGKDFQLPLDKESKLKEGSWYQGEEEDLVFWGKTKEKNGSVRRRLVLMCGKVLFMKKKCANKSMEGSCV